MNRICDGELERGQSSDSRKKSLKKDGIKVDGGHGYNECYMFRWPIMWKENKLLLLGSFFLIEEFSLFVLSYVVIRESAELGNEILFIPNSFTFFSDVMRWYW